MIIAAMRCRLRSARPFLPAAAAPDLCFRRCQSWPALLSAPPALAPASVLKIARHEALLPPCLPMPLAAARTLATIYMFADLL